MTSRNCRLPLSCKVSHPSYSMFQPDEEYLDLDKFEAEFKHHHRRPRNGDAESHFEAIAAAIPCHSGLLNWTATAHTHPKSSSADALFVTLGALSSTLF